MSQSKVNVYAVSSVAFNSYMLVVIVILENILQVSYYDDHKHTNARLWLLTLGFDQFVAPLEQTFFEGLKSKKVTYILTLL